MKSPSVVHPNNFCIDGYVFRVVSDTALSEAQAASAAAHFCRTDRLYKQHRRQVHTVDIRIIKNSQNPSRN
ncbi:MAG: hypothetical protein GY809_06830 [Planctomycetes bacterium]|nr:hypothetical protein [Planctomycetota bacterium]